MRDFRKLRVEDVLQIFWKWRWYLILSTLAIGSLATYYAWSLPPIYRSETTILVESQFVPEDYVRSTVRDTAEDRINSIRQQLNSRSFLQRIIEELQLYGFASQRNFVMESAVHTMRGDYEITRLRNTFILAYQSVDPQRARDVTRRIASELIRINNQTRKSQVTEADNFFEEELRRCASNLAAQEEKIKNFKMAHDAELPEQIVANSNLLSGLQVRLGANETALKKTQDQRRFYERLVEVQTRSMAVEALRGEAPPTDVARRSPKEVGTELRSKLDSKTRQLAEATAKYTGKHPDVAQLKREVRDLEAQLRQDEARMRTTSEAVISPATVTEPQRGRSALDGLPDSAIEELRLKLEATEEEVKTLNKERDSILAQIRVYEGRRLGAPRVEQELLALTREHEALKQQYSDLQQKKFKTQVAANLETSTKNETLKIVDEANLPEKPVGPPRRKIALIGLAAGMLFGIVLVLGREYFDTTVGDEKQAAAELNLPILIAIPEVSARQLALHRVVRKTGSERKVLPLP
jgi:polysaccharide chain length determinant protein (PEP-CTERM system associated)